MGTDNMGSVLDDVLTDRPLANPVPLLDGVAIIAILLLFMRMAYVVLHEDPMAGGDNLLAAAVAAVNVFFLMSQAPFRGPAAPATGMERLGHVQPDHRRPT